MMYLNKKHNLKKIDLRSDTVTLPTDEMRKAMSIAKVGDDVYREDPTRQSTGRVGCKKNGKRGSIICSQWNHG